MDIIVNIDIDKILDSIDIKSLEKYIRRKKIEEIQKPGSITNSTTSTLPFNLTKKIQLNNCNGDEIDNYDFIRNDDDDEIDNYDLFRNDDDDLDFEFGNF